MSEPKIRNEMEEFTASGYWWLPGKDDHELGGSVTFSKKEGAHLELLGMFGDLPVALFERSAPFPTIYGVTTDGKKMTLVNCQSVSAHGNLMGMGVPTETLRVGMIVVGDHIEDFPAMPLRRVTFRVSNLEDWLTRRGVTRTMSPSSGDPFVISYVRPTLPSIRIPGGTLSFLFGWSSFQTDFRTAGIDEYAAVQVSRSDGFTFDEAIRNYVWPIQNLLTLCALEPSDVVEVRVEARGRAKSQPTRLQVYYQSSIEAPERDKPLLFTDMFMTAAQMGAGLPSLIRGWLASSESLRSVLNLYFAVMSGKWMFLESRFINLVQAAEVFHRYTYPNFIVSKALHKKRVTEVLDHAHEKHREWLEGVLNFSNEPRLGTRLETVVDATSSIFGWSAEEQQILVKQARDTRHYLTHYDPKGAKKAVGGERLYWLSEMLLFIIGAVAAQSCRCIRSPSSFRSERQPASQVRSLSMERIESQPGL